MSGIEDSGVDITISAMQTVGKKEAAELRAEQQESKLSFLEAQEEAVNPFAAKFATKQKDIKVNKSRVQKMMESGEKADRLLPIQRIKDAADQFQKRNPELRANILALLRQQIKPGDSKEDILRKLAEFYADVSLADEALEFLLETTEGELALQVQEAKSDFNEAHAREITAGRNISTQAREAAEKGLGTPTSMRDMYRDITGNPRNSTTLFEELSKIYAFKDLKKVIDFLLHSLGTDMKAKGPSIARGMLHRLLSETRSLQAILGVYRFFRSRMHLVETLFSKNGLTMPSQVSFESIAKLFMEFAADRYPTGNKAMQLPSKLGLEKWVLAKIIVLSQMRDAVREVALHQIYKSLQHRDDLYLALLEALEDLEDQLEELEEKEEEEEEEGGGQGDNHQEEEKKDK